MARSTVRKITLFLYGTLALVFMAGCSAPEGNPEQGKRWFTMYNCFSCHGKNANDGRTAEIAAIKMGFRSFEGYLRDPDSPSMPEFPEEKLSKQDAADIYAWLKSLPE